MANHPFNLPVKLLCHSDTLEAYRQFGDCWPFFMEVNLTSKCNLRCNWCISGNFQRKASLGLIEFSNFVSEFAGLGGKGLTFSGGGEPTLHPDFTYFAGLGINSGLDLGLITNGTYSQDKKLAVDKYFKWIRISLDTIDYDEYERWKGVDILDRVLHNILSHNGPSKLAINVNIGMQHTIASVENLILLLKDFVDIVQFRPILPRYYCQEKREINNKVWDYLEDNWLGNPKIVFSLDKFSDLKTMEWPFKKCTGHHFAPILDSNGDICACMYHPGDERFVFGNIYEQSFSQIWLGAKRHQALKFISQLDYCKECQLSCKLTEMNKILDTIASPTADINFV